MQHPEYYRRCFRHPTRTRRLPVGEARSPRLGASNSCIEAGKSSWRWHGRPADRPAPSQQSLKIADLSAVPAFLAPYTPATAAIALLHTRFLTTANPLQSPSPIQPSLSVHPPTFLPSLSPLPSRCTACPASLVSFSAATYRTHPPPLRQHRQPQPRSKPLPTGRRPTGPSAASRKTEIDGAGLIAGRRTRCVLALEADLIPAVCVCARARKRVRACACFGWTKS